MDNNSAVRIQKIISDAGVMSRRAAEKAIEQKRVTVNGRPCAIGQKADPRRDVIAVDGVRVTIEKRKKNLYIILNKPRGYVTTMSDEYGRKCVTDLVADAPARVYPVGRLDRNSEGLLLLTNDGDFANMVMHPGNRITKTYRVTLRSSVTESQIVDLSSGVIVDGKPTLPATVLVLLQEPERSVLQMTISEGRNRQIRKMCEAVGLTVARLRRTSVGPLKLGMLEPGKWRELTPAELSAIRGASAKANISGGSNPRRRKDNKNARN